jgi:uncharacterized protein (DUF952 family)/acetyl esterase/lipase
MKTIYHIAYRKDWNRALVDGAYRTDSLESKGFIHMSEEVQVNKVANSIFKDEKDLLLLYIDYEKVKDRVRWEGKQDYGEDFPHLYGPLPLDAVVKVVEFKPDRVSNFTKSRARSTGSSRLLGMAALLAFIVLLVAFVALKVDKIMLDQEGRLPQGFDDLAETADGSIVSMTLIHLTNSSEYYSITYMSDGLRVNGFLGRPRAEGVHPAIIYNRGGFREYGSLEGWEVALFAEAGYVSVASQYRGNAGSEGREEFGGSDVADVLNLVTLLKGLPYVDPDRIGMMGHSRGGMMTYLALKEDCLAGTRDIKAAASVGGVADLFMHYERKSYIARMVGATPKQNPKRYESRSAIRWPELIDAPLLIQHGEDDRQVSVENSLELAAALEEAGKTYELIVYPGGDHELTDYYGGVHDALAWFQRYLCNPGEDRSFESHGRDIGEAMNWFMNSYRGG